MALPPAPGQSGDTVNAPVALTFNSLFQLILFYLERNDQDVRDFIPYAILFAESKISNKMKQLGQQAVANATINYTPGPNALPPGALQKPTGWRKTISVRWLGQASSGNDEDLYVRSLEYCKNYTKNKAATDVVPKFYSDYNFDYWYITPEPVNNDQFEIIYYEKITPLGPNSQTNWLTINAPELIMFGTLLEMEPFIKNDPRIPTWMQKYDDAMQSLIAEDVSRIGDRNTLRQDQS